MKEQLESNVITKYAAGLMSGEELRALEDWLKKNPQYSVTVALIKQRVDALVGAGRVVLP
jgi:anti-sigma factor RsiW